MHNAVIQNRREWVRRLTASAVCTAVIAVCSQIAVPMPGGVPVTLQTLAVAWTGFFLGMGGSAVSVAVYLALGALGVPVFASFGGGFGVLMGPTGGFLIGFLLMASACGFGRRLRMGKGALPWILPILAGIAGLLLCHLCGTAWFCRYAKTGFWQAAALVSLPYLIKDIASVVVAYLLFRRISGLFRKRGL